MFVIVGLGNPGEEYSRTRHNIGFRCVATLAKRYHLEFDDKLSKARVATGLIAGQRVALAKPFTYMNLSGQALVGLINWYKVDPKSEVLVIYDDLDLPFGTLRLRARGSSGTHNGMRSIVQLLGSEVFPRLRVGIGNGPEGRNAANYVLGRFSPEEEAALPDLLDRAADAVELILRDGLVAAMNSVNAPTPKSSAGSE